MRVSSLFKAASVLPAVGLLCMVSVADAQQDKDQQGCINAMSKDGSKVLSTQGKEAGKCQKDFANGKLVDPVKAPFGNSADACIAADFKGKVAKAKDKTVTKDEPKKCTANQPTIGAGSVGLEGAVVNAVGQDVALQLMQDLFGPSVSGTTVSKAANKDAAGCQQGVLKTVQKCVDTKIKEFDKCKKDGLSGKVLPQLITTGDIADCVTDGGRAGSIAADTKGKVGKACNGVVGKGIDGGVSKKCVGKGIPVGPALDALFPGVSAGATSATLDAVAECAACRWVNRTHGTSIDCDLFDNAAADGSCADIDFCAFPPSSADLTITAGQGGGNTQLSTGWTGLAHNTDISDDFVGNVDFTCVGGGCTSCAPRVGAAYTGNRCQEDHRALCSDPFVTGGDCVQTCLPTFGAPLPLNAAATPVCVVNNIISELDGSANLNTGASSTLVSSRAVVHTGTQSRPCPTCDGDPTANDGVRGGTCTGGPDNGTSCDANATSTEFGSTSYDCRPDAGANVSGLGLDIGLRLTTGTSSITAVAAASGGVSAVCDNGGPCHCAVCSVNTTVPCNTDADCPDKKETCSSAGTGVNPSPNDCSGDGFVCTAAATDGVCATGFETFCDGQTDPAGNFIIPCSGQPDCDALDTECSGGDCGTCSAVQQRTCFLDTVSAAGAPDPADAGGFSDFDLGSTFCIPPTSSPGVNGAGGLPGPGQLSLDFSSQLLCSDGVTNFNFPSGSNCP